MIQTWKEKQKFSHYKKVPDVNAVLKKLVLCNTIYMCVYVFVLYDNAAAATIFCHLYLLNQLVVLDRGIRPMGGEGEGKIVSQMKS